VKRAPRVVDGFQQRDDASRGRHVVDEVPASVAVGPVQPPSRSTVTQSREGTSGPFRTERCVGGIPGYPAFHQDHVVAADLVLDRVRIPSLITTAVSERAAEEEHHARPTPGKGGCAG